MGQSVKLITRKLELQAGTFTLFYNVDTDVKERRSPFAPFNSNHYCYGYVVSLEKEGVKKTLQLPFTGSINDYENRNKMSSGELGWAFRCIIADGLCGFMTREQMEEELGSSRLHRDCVELKNKLAELEISEDDCYSILRELSELGIE